MRVTLIEDDNGDCYELADVKRMGMFFQGLLPLEAEVTRDEWYVFVMDAQSRSKRVQTIGERDGMKVIKFAAI